LEFDGYEHLLFSHQSTVTITCINEDIASGEFDLEFPPTTIVTDMRSNAVYTIDEGDHAGIGPGRSWLIYWIIGAAITGILCHWAFRRWIRAQRLHFSVH